MTCWPALQTQHASHNAFASHRQTTTTHTHMRAGFKAMKGSPGLRCWEGSHQPMGKPPSADGQAPNSRAGARPGTAVGDRPCRFSRLATHMLPLLSASWSQHTWTQSPNAARVRQHAQTPWHGSTSKSSKHLTALHILQCLPIGVPDGCVHTKWDESV